MCPKIYTHEYYHCMSSASGLKKVIDLPTLPNFEAKTNLLFFLMLNYLVHAVTPYFCPGGHSHYGSDADVRLQRPPIFSVAPPNDPTFADCLCCHPMNPTILHSAATGSYLLFQDSTDQ